MSLLSKTAIGRFNPGTLAGMARKDIDRNLPTEQVTDLDEGSKALINRQIEQAALTPDEVANRDVAAASAAHAQTPIGEISSKPLGVDDEALRNVLANKARSSFGNSLQMLKTESKLNATPEILRQNEKAVRGAQQLSNIRSANYAAKLNNISQKKAARAQLFGQIIGAGSTLAAYGIGGAGGAAFGQAMGKSVTGGGA